MARGANVGAGHGFPPLHGHGLQPRQRLEGGGSGYILGTMEKLPQDLSALSPERVSQAANVRDKRLSALFRRWPSLSKVETTELKRLYDERLRVAKHVGAMRTLLLRRRSGRAV